MDKEQIKNIVANKIELIDLKKAELKHCKGGLSNVATTKTALKGLYSNTEEKLERTIIGNTYMWLDSHGDVHAKKCFAKSIKERQDKIFHLHDHEFKRTSKVGEPISIYEKDITWKELGVNKSGSTQALHMDTEVIKAYNAQIFNEYKNDIVDQHSVGMQYIKIDLAVNDEEFEDEHKIWLDNIDNIGNKDKAEENGMFWLVREAKLIEISAVLLGSNEITPTLGEKIEPLKDTQKEAAKKALQDKKEYYKHLN